MNDDRKLTQFERIDAARDAMTKARDHAARWDIVCDRRDVAECMELDRWAEWRWPDWRPAVDEIRRRLMADLSARITAAAEAMKTGRPAYPPIIEPRSPAVISATQSPAVTYDLDRINADLDLSSDLDAGFEPE